MNIHARALTIRSARSWRPLQPCRSLAANRVYRRHNSTQQSLPRGNDKSAVGVFTPKAAIVFVLTGVGLYFYFNHEKKKLQEQKKKELESRKWGKAAVGGPFELTTHKGEPFTEKNLLGKWSLVYFGFTNCPDICPEELDKMTEVVNVLDKQYGPISQPIFISVDPARDPPSQIALYLRDFHPRLIGLSGTYEQTRAVCKAYRVYFSTPKDAQPDGDYLVDHSIYFYLMDPEGEFVEAFGKVNTVEDVVRKVQEEVGRWEKEHGGSRT
ncbi:h-sco1 [Fomitiporia mediterranea MF3/22]|uniref:h-sco1 n=1 Tax=Fomitiporia mediterranea (strain MF3/22) TaxID=694068 RepID=UPI000440906E|nr:h-sco1 [Fomitiporia mediterranea MF3/22]EJD00782.1 h-sco1 [Fomitiporia mediterranea MF3/22]